MNALVSFWHFLFYVTSCITNELIINNKCPKDFLKWSWNCLVLVSAVDWHGRKSGRWSLKIFQVFEAIGRVWSSGEKRHKKDVKGGQGGGKKRKEKWFKKSMLNITESCLYNHLWMWSGKTFQVLCKWCMFKSRQTLCLAITAGCTRPLFFHWVPLHSAVCLRKWLFSHQWMSEVWPCMSCQHWLSLPHRPEGAKLRHSAFGTDTLSTASKRTWLAALSSSVCFLAAD